MLEGQPHKVKIIYCKKKTICKTYLEFTLMGPSFFKLLLGYYEIAIVYVLLSKFTSHYMKHRIKYRFVYITPSQVLCF